MTRYPLAKSLMGAPVLSRWYVRLVNKARLFTAVHLNFTKRLPCGEYAELRRGG